MSFGTSKQKTREIAHITGLSRDAARLEINYYDMIHPQGEIDIQAFLKTVPCTDWSEWNCKELKKNSGVYAITWDNKSFYVGETVNTFANRLQEHREALFAGKHYNRKLQRAYDKYCGQTGADLGNVKIYLLEYGMCDQSCKGMFKLRNLLREYYYQQMFDNDKKYKLLSKEDTLKVIYNWRGLRDYTIEETFYHVCTKDKSAIRFYCDAKGKNAIPQTYDLVTSHDYNTLNGDEELYKEIRQCLREHSESFA